jgi:mono/diheme cytochrome c family protein
MKSRLTLLALVALVAALASCGPPRVAVGAPLTPEDAKLANGARVFMAECQQCHPNGAEGLGPALNDKPAPAFLIKLQVRVGLGAMPSFGPDEINDEALDDLAAFVIELRRRAQSSGGGSK